MKRLSPQSYWDSIYKNFNKSDDKHSLFFYVKEKIKFYTRDYSNYLIWEVVFKKLLPKNEALNIIEIGCAPGKYLISFNKDFGYIPYGVEFSKKGALITKQNFISSGLDVDNIFENDFFDESFQVHNQDKYDLVFSRGFIEHFDDVQKVVNYHLKLLKSGGYLIIMIPNLSGLNYFLAKNLNNDSLLLHNLSIMNKEKFEQFFDKEVVRPLYSDYIGVFSFGLFNTNNKFKHFLHRFLTVIQRPVDFMLRIIFGSKVLKSRFTSPYLLFIGIKQ